MDSKPNQKIVYGAGEGYLSTGTAPRCKAGPTTSLSSNRGHPGVGRQAPDAFMRLARETREPGGLGEGREPTTKCRVLPLRPLRLRPASGRITRLPGPLKAPSPPLPSAAVPTAATTREATKRRPDRSTNN